jgi:low affinity Fe/Cu permease
MTESNNDNWAENCFIFLKVSGFLGIIAMLVIMFSSQFIWFSRFLDFRENCQKYIQRSSNASTIELAQKQMTLVLTQCKPFVNFDIGIELDFIGRDR